MSFLVDTNVFSEPAKPKPDPQVLTWLREHESDLYVSALTIGELRRGVELLNDGRRKVQLQKWLADLCNTMRGRILSFNTATAHVWGQYKAKWDRAGITVPSLDSQIAAIAIRHSLTIVSRNSKDFEKTGVKVTNPFPGTTGRQGT